MQRARSEKKSVLAKNLDGLVLGHAAAQAVHHDLVTLLRHLHLARLQKTQIKKKKTRREE